MATPPDPSEQPTQPAPTTSEIRDPGTPGLSSASAPSKLFAATGAAPTPAALAPHFPELEVLELLGQGGMGAVYKARQRHLDRLVALKVLPPQSAGDPTFAERFTREARTLARLNHPNIVAMYEFGQAGGLAYFLMEFVDGVTLRHLLRTRNLGAGEALRIVREICEGLQFAHDGGIVHRDIKPENILLDKKGRVKLADFGIAKLISGTTLDYTLTGPWQVVGTWNYMAPEQMDNPLAVDHRADVYALGVVAYEMLTGELPRGRFLPPSYRAPVDEHVDRIVLRALATERLNRYQRVSELKTELEKLARRPEPVPPVAGPPSAAGAGLGGHGDRPAEPGALVARPRAEILDRKFIAAARKKVFAPATALFVVGFLNFLAMALVLLALVRSLPTLVSGHASGILLPGTFLVLNALCGVLVCLGAWGMRRLAWYRFALTAAVLAMAPFNCPAYLFSVPVGIWCWLTLRRPEVMAAFKATRQFKGGENSAMPE